MEQREVLVPLAPGSIPERVTLEARRLTVHLIWVSVRAVSEYLDPPVSLWRDYVFCSNGAGGLLLRAEVGEEKDGLTTLEGVEVGAEQEALAWVENDLSGRPRRTD